MNYYDRLKACGWEQYYRGSRWDYFKKVDHRGMKWTVAVPCTTFVEPIFSRNGVRLSPTMDERRKMQFNGKSTEH